MTKIGGTYLNPVTFFSEKYSHGDFMNELFWNTEKSKWGQIVHNFEHTSTSFVKRNGAKIKIKCDKNILFSTDGLLCTALPEEIQSDDEALIVLSGSSMTSKSVNSSSCSSGHSIFLSGFFCKKIYSILGRLTSEIVDSWLSNRIR